MTIELVPPNCFQASFVSRGEVLGKKFISPGQIFAFCGVFYNAEHLANLEESFPETSVLKRVKDLGLVLLPGLPLKTSLGQVVHHFKYFLPSRKTAPEPFVDRLRWLIFNPQTRTLEEGETDSNEVETWWAIGICSHFLEDCFSVMDDQFRQRVGAEEDLPEAPDPRGDSDPDFSWRG